MVAREPAAGRVHEPLASGPRHYSYAVAGSPASVLARRLGIRTGRVAVPGGLLAILAGTLLFLLPPHSAIATIVLGVGGVAVFSLGIGQLGSEQQANDPWWPLITAVVSGALLLVALNVDGRGLALRLFGHSESCSILRRDEVDTSARYPHDGFVHTVDCPGGGIFTIRTDSTDRQEPGARVQVLDDPGGLLEPDFASRHNLAVDSVGVCAALGAVAASVVVRRRAATSAS